MPWMADVALPTSEILASRARQRRVSRVKIDKVAIRAIPSLRKLTCDRLSAASSIASTEHGALSLRRTGRLMASMWIEDCCRNGSLAFFSDDAFDRRDR
jgi:hypothetical protein